jgi:hypothetical protein
VRAQAASDTTTAIVERRDLVDHESIEGTLGYADAFTLTAGAAGTVTDLPDPGTVILRGQSLYDVNAPRPPGCCTRRCRPGATSRPA